MRNDSIRLDCRQAYWAFSLLVIDVERLSSLGGGRLLAGDPEQVEQAMGSKPVSRAVPWSLYQLLLPDPALF